MANKKIIIVGAGLSGSLLALRMAQRGFEVDVFEKRPDLRKEELDAGRSINLALSNRGIRALASAGITEKVTELCIPMHGRMIHSKGSEPRLSRYSGRSSDYINSISRPGLNALLLNEGDKYENARFHFNKKCTHVDLQSSIITVEDEETGEISSHEGEVVFGTDGAGSAVRKSMMQHTNQLRFSYSQDFLSHGYKELSILPNEDGGFKINKNALHIWPRTSHMIIALPNLDGSFTVTMFHPYDGEYGFDTLNTNEKIVSMFQKEYPELLELMPHLLDDYHENPTSSLATIRCNPWQSYGKALLMGDAAHAVVPFYGQGMNASLEDVYVFDQYFDQFGENWTNLFKAYEQSRIPNANAIADLALDNFYEMRDHVDDQVFIHKRALEMQLEQKFESYNSKYSLVTFKEDIPYQEAMLRGRAQDKMLYDICKENSNPDLNDALEKLKSIVIPS